MKKSKKPKFHIGDQIEFTAAYARNVSARFRKPYDSYGRCGRNPNPLPKNPAQGYVIGIRSVYMADYDPGYWDGEDGFIFGSGTKETVLLVTKGMTREPFLVRFQDVEAIKPMFARQENRDN